MTASYAAAQPSSKPSQTSGMSSLAVGFDVGLGEQLSLSLSLVITSGSSLSTTEEPSTCNATVNKRCEQTFGYLSYWHRHYAHQHSSCHINIVVALCHFSTNPA